MNERLKELISQAFLDVFKEPLDWADSDVSQSAWVERFAELVRDDEREACASLCYSEGKVRLAETIRARVQK